MSKEKNFTSFDGATIHYHVSYGKKKKWLIFLHGLGGDLTAWRKERRYFDSLGLSTIALDLRGHGLSQRSQEKDFYKLTNFAKDISVLIQAEKIDDCVLVGHCFGGMVSISFGATFPQLPTSLILVDTSYRPPFISSNFVERTFLKIILDLFAMYLPNFKEKGHANFLKFTNTPDLSSRRLLSDILHTSLRSYLLICENMIDYNAQALLSKIIKPTLVIDGTADSIFPPDVAEAIKERIKRSELDLIEGANHILILNNPADLNESIHSFLKKTRFT